MENKKMSPSQYWEWRASIAEMQLSQEHFKIASLRVELLNKDVEIIRLNARIASSSLTTYKEKVDLTKSEYLKLKERLESEIGVSFNNKIIDDITFEIKEIEETTKE